MQNVFILLVWVLPAGRDMEPVSKGVSWRRKDWNSVSCPKSMGKDMSEAVVFYFNKFLGCLSSWVS